eukprot:3714335-Rhodomonas_salina.1
MDGPNVVPGTDQVAINNSTYPNPTSDATPLISQDAMATSNLSPPNLSQNVMATLNVVPVMQQAIPPF